MKKNTPLLGFFGHHRCGSSWIFQIVTDVSKLLGMKSSIGLHRPELFNDDLYKYVTTQNIEFVCYTNADFKFIKDIKSLRGFHVIRDPRDILVSSYFSHLHSHPTDDWPQLVKHRERLHSVSKEEGLFLEMEFRSWEFEHLDKWNYKIDDILEVKLEEISQSPLEKFCEIFQFLGILNMEIDEESFSPLLTRIAMTINAVNIYSNQLWPLRWPTEKLSRAQLAWVIEKNSFSKLSGGRKKGQENIKSHYRKGVSGDWRNHFTEDLTEVFKEKYGHLLVKTGYENSRDWKV